MSQAAGNPAGATPEQIIRAMRDNVSLATVLWEDAHRCAICKVEPSQSLSDICAVCERDAPWREE